MNWTPGIMVQAEDRVHRIGQVNAVNVYYCYGDGTVDSMIYPRLKLKSEVFANVLDGKQTEFQIENDNDGEAENGEEGAPEAGSLADLEKNKQMTKEARLIQKAMSFDEQIKFQQTNIQDFFFSSGGGLPGQSGTGIEPTESQLNT